MLWRAPEGEWEGQAAFILGGGPSLKGFDASLLKGRGKVIAVNEAGLSMAPWADVLFWADHRWLEWNKDRLYLHTGPLKLCRSIPTIELPVKAKAMIYNAKNFSWRNDRLGGCCAGSSALNLAGLLGANPIVLLGFDMHDPPINRWREGNWHDAHKEPPLENQRRERFIPVFEEWAPMLLARGITVLNANRNSALRCFPFVDIEELLRLDDVSKAEREKYLEIWQHDIYRKHSFGMDECEKATKIMGISPGQSLIDFGSGSCAAAKWFMDHNVKVLGIDIAENASQEPSVPVLVSSLWELPVTTEAADYGFCTDVMEHIPPAYVNRVLATIASLVRKSAWFHISTRPDNFGPRLIGHRLHMTIEKADWWRYKLMDHFPIVDVIEKHDDQVTIMVRSEV